MDLKKTIIELKDENEQLSHAWAWANGTRQYWPLATFALGFTWDTLTLARIDDPMAYVQLLIYLAALIVFTTLVRISEKGRITSPLLEKYQHAFPLVVQFVFGGLFSAMTLYYFQSAAFSQNLIFVLLLVSLTLGVEFLEGSLSNPYLQFALQYLVTASLMAFMLPMLFNILAPWTFAAAILIALVLLYAQLGVYHQFDLMPKRKQLGHIAGILPVLALVFYSLHSLNLIPPVPLALKDAGTYHKLEVKKGVYYLSYEAAPWYIFWQKINQPFHKIPGAKDNQIIVFTPIFAPRMLKAKIYHHWLHWSKSKREWVQLDKIGFEISGGREVGHRSYTKKKRFAVGEWRVEVKTEEGRLLGVIPFFVKEVTVKNFDFSVHKY
ncbi:MAG: DUF2914 domain-containing protein [SAR324 cluster bacterium]|nr:DUF2914 domain-containing protein [SAR324 cluster bacterium]